jgi:hypothetical protein
LRQLDLSSDFLIHNVSACQGFHNSLGMAGNYDKVGAGGADGSDIYVEREGEAMNSCGLSFSLGDGSGFAHGLN